MVDVVDVEVDVVDVEVDVVDVEVDVVDVEVEVVDVDTGGCVVVDVEVVVIGDNEPTLGYSSTSTQVLLKYTENEPSSVLSQTDPVRGLAGVAPPML